MDEIVKYIIHSYNSLWNIKRHGNTIEIITPIATTNNMFVSVFLTKRGDEYIVTDGGWIDSGMYECEVGFEDVSYNKLFEYYLEDYEIMQLEAKGSTYYYKKIESAKLVPNLVYDLSNFINAVISASFIPFEERKEKEKFGRFRRNANAFIKNLGSKMNVKIETNHYIDERIKAVRFSAIAFKKEDLLLLNYVTGSNPNNFILSLGKSNLSYDVIDNSTIGRRVRNKIALIDDTTKVHAHPNIYPLLNTVKTKAGRTYIPWSKKEELEVLFRE